MTWACEPFGQQFLTSAVSQVLYLASRIMDIYLEKQLFYIYIYIYNILIVLCHLKTCQQETANNFWERSYQSPWINVAVQVAKQRNYDLVSRAFCQGPLCISMLPRVLYLAKSISKNSCLGEKSSIHFTVYIYWWLKMYKLAVSQQLLFKILFAR